MRKIVLIPDDADLMPAYRGYWENFVFRVRTALDKDGLDFRLFIADVRADAPERPTLPHD